MSTSRYAVVRRLSRVLLLPLHGQAPVNDRIDHHGVCHFGILSLIPFRMNMSALEATTTTAYLHRVDSASPRLIIIRQNSFKIQSTRSINTSAIDSKPPPTSTIVTSVPKPKKYRKSLFNMQRRQAKGSSAARDQRICTKQNCLTCCKKFTTFMFSRVGLFFVMIGYVALGGLLFRELEAPHEEEMRRKMGVILNSTLYKLWDEILRVNSYPYIDKKGNFTLYATQELEGFEETVKQQVQLGFDGRTRSDADTDWNYFGAVLYAVTLVSTIGYGHITTKTLGGKIATMLYSAFGVPLMMLFVANMGSTMAKMFAFVFSRLTMLFCCRWKTKKKRKSMQNPSKLAQTSVILDGKLPIAKTTTKSSLKQTKDEKISIDENDDQSSKLRLPTDDQSSTTTDVKNPIPDNKSLPADVRLNMLTGIPTTIPKSVSLTSSASSTGERSKDALLRINELIQQTSVLDMENKSNDDVLDDHHPLSFSPVKQDELNPIQFYINETNKLTSNLENSLNHQTIGEVEQEKMKTTNLDDTNTEQVETSGTATVATSSTATPIKSIIKTTDEKKKSAKKKLKRSKSESIHNRKERAKANNNNNPDTPPTTEDAEITKPARRGFFARKFKKQAALEDDTNKVDLSEQESSEILTKASRRMPRKSQSFNEFSRPVSPPPDYEESSIHELTSPSMVTWKPDNEFYTTKTPFNLSTNPGDADELYEEEDEEMTVPLLVTVFVIPLYLTLGAILFNIWEKWGFLNSFYFCFITLTTIGFGDFVPGSALTVSAAKEKLISAALYILLGLVLIAMCFNLMKEQLSQKVKRVAGKWGILEF